MLNSVLFFTFCCAGVFQTEESILSTESGVLDYYDLSTTGLILSL